MPYTQITDQLSISGQIAFDELETIKSAGFVAIINNRPDNEAPGQPLASDMAARAAELGLGYFHIPLGGPPYEDEQLAQFRAALDAADGSVLAHCKSGMRSTWIWALSHAKDVEPEGLIGAAASAGIDISALAPLLEAQNEG